MMLAMTMMMTMMMMMMMPRGAFKIVVAMGKRDIEEEENKKNAAGLQEGTWTILVMHWTKLWN